MQAHKHVRYLSTASIGHYFGWVGMSGALFWVGRGGWGIILGGWWWWWVGLDALFDNALSNYNKCNLKALLQSKDGIHKKLNSIAVSSIIVSVQIIIIFLLFQQG